MKKNPTSPEEYLQGHIKNRFRLTFAKSVFYAALVEACALYHT